MPVNKIVVYEGGGYDGCVWEPNAFLFDWEGEFVDLGSSGRNGIEDPIKALEAYKQIKSGNGTRNEHIYHTLTKKHMMQLCDDWASVYLQTFVGLALKHYADAPSKVRDRLKLAWYCGKCHDPVTTIENIEFINLRSFGGIMFGTTDMICSDCYNQGVCQKCQDNGGVGDEAYWPEQVEKNGGLCNYHYDRAVIDFLDEGRIKPVDIGVELLEIQKTVAKGKWQLKELYRRKGVTYDKELDSQWQNSLRALQTEMVRLWQWLNKDERLALTIPEWQCNLTQDPQPNAAVQLTLPLS